MILVDQVGKAVPAGSLLARLRCFLTDRPSVVRSGNPGEVLTGVLAAFRGGFKLALEDGSDSRSPEHKIAVDAGSSSEVESLETLRSFLLEGRATGGIRLATSGTTGKPTWVEHSWSSLSRGVKIGERHGEAVWGLCYNPSHIAGLQVLLQGFLNDCDVVDLFHAPPTRRSRLIRDGKVTHLSATPSWMRILIFDLSGREPVEGVRSVTFGGERLDPSLLASARRVFPNARFRNVYAATEFGTLLVSEGAEFTLPESLRGSVRIEDGRLWVSGALLPGSVEGSASWYDSGDRVEVCGENPLRFRFVGRESDNVSVGGYNVNLSEVESRLREHPGVREVRVAARPNSVLGQILTAEVVPSRPDLEESDFRNHLEKFFPPHAVPRMIRIVDGLSLSRTGKLKR